MGMLTVLRHAQASFGAADYDKLSALGHVQSRALGAALAAQGLPAPDAVVTGAQRRHGETLDGVLAGLGLGQTPPRHVHPGWNEFDARALIAAFRDGATENASTDRADHFRTLRAAVEAWHAGALPGAPESYADFCARVAEAAEAARGLGDHVLVVSSGGAIGELTRQALAAPPATQIRLQLQLKNAAVTRFVTTRTGLLLHGFNETPQITAATPDLLTYS